MLRSCKTIVTRRFRKFLRDTSGNLSLTLALSMVPIIGVVGLAIDMSRASATKRALHDISDGAALAAASAAMGTKPNERSEIALRFIAANQAALGAAEITSKSVKVGAESIDVKLGAEIKGQMIKVLGVGLGSSAVEQRGKLEKIDVSAKSLAMYNPVPGPCVLALSPSKYRAATFSGSANVTFQNCTVMSNANTSSSIYFGGASVHVSAACFVAVGKIDGSTSNYTMTTCDSITENFIATPDPYANIAVPTKPPGACKNIKNTDTVLDPGYYCTMNINKNITLNTGAYTIASTGQLKVGANVTLTGSGVTFYLEGNSTVDFASNGTMKLSAPVSGPQAGILLFGDRTNTSLQRMNGTSNSYLTGALYFKSGAVDFRGNYSGQNGCMQIVADTIEMSGNTTMTNACESYGIAKISGAQIVRLAN
jgi:hypothetical protein